MSYTFADNDLTGNGLAPESLLARDRRAVYTYPDRTANLMHLVNLRGSQWLTDDLLVSANTFYRNYKRTTSNGDEETSCVDDDSGAVAFTSNGRVVALGNCAGEAAGFVDRNGDPLDGELEREAEGEFRRTKTTTQDWGATLQLSYKGKILGFGNRVTAGVAYDGHASHFTQSEAEASLVPNGNSVAVQKVGPFETDVDVHTDQQNIGVYLTDTFDITDWMALTAGARYQHVNIKTAIRGNPEPQRQPHLPPHQSGGRADGAAPQEPNVFGAYSEGFRAPTAAELSSPIRTRRAPCPTRSSPTPRSIRWWPRPTSSGRAGRCRWTMFKWSLAFFRTDVHDDILFTQTETTGAGFFQNVAETRRQGVEVGVQGRRGSGSSTT